MVEYSSIPLPRTEFIIEDDRALPELPETKQYLQEMRKRQKKKRKEKMDPTTLFLDMLKKQKAQAASSAPPIIEASAGPNRGLGPVPAATGMPSGEGNPLMSMVKGFLGKDANPMQGSGTPMQSKLMEAVSTMGGNNTQMGAPPAPEAPQLAGPSMPNVQMSQSPIFAQGHSKDPMSMLQMLMQMIRGG